MLMPVPLADIRTNAKSKGNIVVCLSEEVPGRLRIYISRLSWTGVIELYVCFIRVQCTNV